MKPVKSFSACLGISIALFFSSALAEELLIDDFTDGDSVNSLAGGWIYYDDVRGCGPNCTRLQAIGSQSSAVDTRHTFFQKPGGGFDYNIRVYIFEVYELDAEKYVHMPFTYGDTWQDSATQKAEAFVGASTTLGAAGLSMDITKYKTVKFKLRSPSALKVTFMLETKDIATDSTYAYYQKVVNVTPGAWNNCSLSISSLAQPAWTPQIGKKAFNSAQVTAMTWEVSLGNNPDLEEIKAGELDVDDVILSDVPVSVTMRNSPASAQQSSFSAFYQNGILRIDGESLKRMSEGSVNLFDAKGKLVMTRKVTVADMNLSCPGLPAGLYIAQATDVGSDGKSVTLRSPFFVAK